MGTFDLLDLSRQLKQERLFINSEREQLHALNEEVTRAAERLYHLAWIAKQQKQTLDQLLRAEREFPPEKCCEIANSVENAVFVDGYKCLSYHESKIGEFLKALRECPKLMAACLVQYEHEDLVQMHQLAHIAVHSLYGSCIMPEDEVFILQLLQSLIGQQIAPSEDPRRLLRKGSCAFSTVFKLLNENLFSAKIFLTAALHRPIMQLLMEDEWFYDIDPERALHRFPPSERAKRFSNPGTAEFEAKTREYRQVTTNKLVMLTERFIVSLKANLYCFPTALGWLVNHLYHTVIKAGKVDASEARAMCADLIFSLFICPAICDPEPFGITSDTPISYIARHNLMQVAQILQILAISPGQDSGDAKTRDLYSKFEKGCMSSMLDLLLQGSSPDQLNVPSPMPGCGRSAALIHLSQLIELITCMRQLVTQLEEGSSERKILEDVLASVPPVSVIQALQTTPYNTPQPTPPGTPPTHKKNRGSSHRKRLLLTPDAGSLDDEDEAECSDSLPEEVLVVSLGIINECPGMLTEQKVLDQETKQRNYIPGEEDAVSASEVQLHEKRTRFSLSHDQDSIATSDNLEAISENASSHSVGSDNENDNLSDFVSANVSGRGTPNISGRDTPLSQAESQPESVEERRAPDLLPVIVQKNNREDVTDRFGKFEIKAELERDEIKSTVSDTWSTDVFASDSEAAEPSQLDRLEEVAEDVLRQNLIGIQEVAEVSETASDAWSTDVLASDTSERQADRLMELDQDEVASVSSRSQGQDGSEAGDVSDDVSSNPGIPSLSGAGEFVPVDSEAGRGAYYSPVGMNRDLLRRPLARPDRISDPAGGFALSTAANLNAQEGRRAVSDIIGNFNHIESNKHSYTPNQRISTSFMYSEGKVHSVLNSFDPLSPVKASESDGCSALPQGGAMPMHGTATSTPAGMWGMSKPLNSSTLLSPDQGIYSPSSEGISHNNGANSSNKRDRDSGVPATPQDIGPLDMLAYDVANGLKLTEQQNMNIDANRLSATIMLFDPLMQESSTDDVDADRNTRQRPLSEPSGGRSAFSRVSDGGARPKTALGGQSSTPRISFQNDFDGDAASLARHKKSEQTDILIHLEQDYLDGHPLENGKRASTSSNLSVHSTDSLTKSRSSTESSCSSLVDISVNSAQNAQEFETKKIKVPPQEVEEQRNPEPKKKSSGGFLKTFKERLSKGGKRKVSKGTGEEARVESDKGGAGDIVRLGGEAANDESTIRSKAPSVIKGEDPSESSDDILAKYRKQPVTGLPDPNSGTKYRSVSMDAPDGCSPTYDPSNLEQCKAFMDAKRKLRLVLSTADFHILPALAAGAQSYVQLANDKRDNDLVSFLKLQLAEAINLQDKDLIAQLHETIRCLKQFNNEGVRKLLKTMREEYKSRSPYVAYLVRCRQGLLAALAHLERLLNRIQRDKTVCNKYFLSVFVRFFLEKQERTLVRFIANFQKLSVPDEKTDLVEEYLNSLGKHMRQDVIWKAATDQQLEEAQLFIERNVMSHIYTHAMYPNGDADMLRDQIQHDHMKKLARIITPIHKDLGIPKVYHYECPWPAAQAEIFMINAYKTPKDKLACVLRCSSTIMNLLSMANEKSVPAADDFMPVLIFVLIKANPPSLLSTVQYVNNFYESRLAGEEQYWWMQFSSAIEFIKTMEYTD